MPQTPQLPDEMDERSQERDARIDELEGRLARRGRSGVRWFVSVAALLACGYFTWFIRLDVAYFFADRTPLTLGAEGDYHFDGLRSNVYAQLHGLPTTKGVYSQDHGRTWVGVGMQDTPVIVWRKAFPSEVWSPGSKPPTPNQSRLAVRGRLLAQGDARNLKELFTNLGPRDNLHAVGGRYYVLREGERPGDDFTPLLLLGLLVFFFSFNGWLLLNEVRFRVREMQTR